MAVPSSPCAPAARRSRSAPAPALGSARRQRRYRHLTGLRAGRRPALLSEADLLPVPSGVPEGGDDGELVAVPLGGRAELDVECLEKEPPGSGEACDACRIILLNTSLLLYVLVVENETNGACGASRLPGTIGTWRTQMPDRLGRSQPGADTDVITRAAAVPALAALAVIHVDLPGMPGRGPAGRVQVPRDCRGRDCGRRRWQPGLTGWPGRPPAGSPPPRWPGMCCPGPCPGASSATTAMSATGAARWASRRSAHSSRLPVPASGEPEKTTSRISR